MYVCIYVYVLINIHPSPHYKTRRRGAFLYELYALLTAIYLTIASTEHAQNPNRYAPRRKIQDIIKKSHPTLQLPPIAPPGPDPQLSLHLLNQQTLLDQLSHQQLPIDRPLVILVRPHQLIPRTPHQIQQPITPWTGMGDDLTHNQRHRHGAIEARIPTPGEIVTG